MQGVMAVDDGIWDDGIAEIAGRWLRGDKYAARSAYGLALDMKGMAVLGEQAQRCAALCLLTGHGEPLTMRGGALVPCFNRIDMSRAREMVGKKPEPFGIDFEDLIF